MSYTDSKTPGETGVYEGEKTKGRNNLEDSRLEPRKDPS